MHAEAVPLFPFTLLAQTKGFNDLSVFRFPQQRVARSLPVFFQLLFYYTAAEI